MEHKPIYLDGVNVSGCTYSKIGIDKKCYCEQDLYDDGTPVFTCDECTDCYYKQLKRKEQECEELKERLERIEEDLKYQCVDCMNIKSDRYRKALEEIEAATKINCEEICGRKFADCNDTSCFSAEILDIINKAKGEECN